MSRSLSSSVLVLALALAARSGGAQACDSVTSRTTLAAFAGDTIRALHVVTQGPAPLPGPAAVADYLHVTTRESTVRRHLLFAVGDTIDTLRVFESLRRLRAERYLADAMITGVRCAGVPGVVVTVTTRDDWSTRPSVTSSGTNSVLGLTERNVLGTGREAAFYVRSSQSRIGIGAALRDPWFLGSRFAARLTTDTYRDGHDWGATLATRPESVYDWWRSELALSGNQRASLTPGGDAFARDRGLLLVMRRVAASPAAVTSLIAGADGERTSLVAGRDAVVLGPTHVEREWLGLDLGVQRRSAAWDTLTWLLPRNAIVDVPLAVEGEVLVGGGGDLRAGQPGARLDAWTGKMWLPSRQSLLVGDLWASGYRIGHRVDAGSVRGSLAYYHAAARGTWRARLEAEHLFNPDPDVRALASTDLTLGAIPHDMRLAYAAAGASLERDVHLFGLTRSWGVDAGAFAAASARWDPAAPGAEDLHIALAGVGLRLAPTKTGRGAARIDLGYPLLASPQLKRRPVVMISVTPWIGESRQRAGARDR